VKDELDSVEGATERLRIGEVAIDPIDWSIGQIAGGAWAAAQGTHRPASLQAGPCHLSTNEPARTQHQHLTIAHVPAPEILARAACTPWQGSLFADVRTLRLLKRGR
jgi:hypothetical protein